MRLVQKFTLVYSMLLLIILLKVTIAFKCFPSQSSIRNSQKLRLIPDHSFFTAVLQKVTKAEASAEFYFFFFAGSGALGIGDDLTRSVKPSYIKCMRRIEDDDGKPYYKSTHLWSLRKNRILKEFEILKSYGGGPSLGGEDLSCNFLATIGYPESLKVKDVEQIIKNCPSVDKILAKGEKKTYMAQMGYVEKGAFDLLLPKSNPLARYAVFEAISGGGGSNVASPIDFVEKIATWRGNNGIEQFKQDLLKASLKKYAAFSVFAFLIYLVLDLIIESGINAFID